LQFAIPVPYIGEFEMLPRRNVFATQWLQPLDGAAGNRKAFSSQLTPDLARAKIPFGTLRTFTERLRPPCLPGRIKGSTGAHSASVRSLG
jgi:hypothetical protein